MKQLFCLFSVCLLVSAAYGADIGISTWNRTGALTWTNAFSNGVCTVESAAIIGTSAGPWQVQQIFFTTNTTGQASLVLSPSNTFVRLLAVDVSTNTPQGYTNLLQSYGLLETVAGKGIGGIDGTNYWRASYEGGYATNAALSRPHFAMADDVGNIFIVDKDSHSVLKVTPDGRIHTVAGSHLPGDGTNASTIATNVALNSPNGLWVRGDGTAYVLDTGNGKVRRLDTNGMMTTLFTVSSGINGGRGLWVKDDESLVYFCSGTDLRKRVPGDVTTLNNNFIDLGNIVVNAAGDILATDRGDNKIYLVDATGGNVGGRTKIFGNGTTNSVIEGTQAKTNGLYGVRGVWPVPTGGYLLALHEGSQVLYVDAAGLVYVFVDGTDGNT